MGYRGADRRGGVPAVPTRAIVAAGLVGGLPALLAAAALASRDRGDLATMAHLAPLLWLVVVVEAALALVMVWHVAGLVRDAWVAAALTVLGFTAPLLYYVDRFAHGEARFGAWPSGVLAVLASLPLIACAVWKNDVDTRTRGWHLGVATAVVMVAALAVDRIGGSTLAAVPTTGRAIAEVGCAGMFLVIGSRSHRLDANLRVVLWSAVMGYLLARMSLVVIGSIPSSSWQIAGVLTAIVSLFASAAVLLTVAMARARGATRHTRGRELRLVRQAWNEARRRKQESTRRHDARSALAAVSLAHEALLRSGAALDDEARRELADAAIEELRRVAALLQAPDEENLSPDDVAEVS